ncbi:DUF1997 domain-containing protein [Planktothrix agardhii]|uniref:DUF1997 domain-containing protein n=1 Tax=Planktothrix agardhii TaxID=1160 RepID=UPI0020A762CF|nr:DUF1997 domain-containing protein [Planktothrix agardhii]CAD5979630.1 hypothetical protein NO758_04469 [Planktothrix agardhii]
MPSDISEPQPSRASSEFVDDSVALPNPEESNQEQDSQELIWFHSDFEDCMEMFAPLDTVAEYLGQHSGWFCRCALPMKTEPMGNNAYDLLVGRFGALGYRVEARIGLELVPPDAEGIYRIRTVPIPNYTAPGYEVDFQSTMTLVDLPTAEFCSKHRIELKECPTQITGAKWHLDLAVGVQIPKFIRSKSEGLIQKSGDTLLKNIVKQVSRRLSAKTQQDFHTSLGIPFPKYRG